jgi:hypothetical protein
MVISFLVVWTSRRYPEWFRGRALLEWQRMWNNSAWGPRSAVIE